jgi:hypothetical protein
VTPFDGVSGIRRESWTRAVMRFELAAIAIVVMIRLPALIGVKCLALSALWMVGEAIVAGPTREGSSPSWRAMAFVGLLWAGGGVTFLQVLERPFLPVCLFSFGAFLLGAGVVEGAGRLVLLYGAAGGLALLIGEIACGGGAGYPGFGSLLGGWDIEVTEKGTGRKVGNEYTVPDAARGWAGRPDSTVRWRSVYEARLVFDAMYTISKEGTRETPAAGQDVTENLVLLGDSIAFGQGLNDDETIGARLQEALGGRCRVSNLALIGYGPHQALATLEEGLDRKIVEPNLPVRAVYYAAFDLMRAAGRRHWDTAGPCYRLDPDGVLRFKGSFQDWRPARFFGLLNKSMLIRSILSNRVTRKSDMDLFVAILRRADALVRERWGSGLLVILWARADEKYFGETVALLRKAGVRTLTVQEAVAGTGRTEAQFRIPIDGHPSADGQIMIAQAVLKMLEPEKMAHSGNAGLPEGLAAEAAKRGQ